MQKDLFVKIEGKWPLVTVSFSEFVAPNSLSLVGFVFGGGFTGEFHLVSSKFTGHLVVVLCKEDALLKTISISDAEFLGPWQILNLNEGTVDQVTVTHSTFVGPQAITEVSGLHKQREKFFHQMGSAVSCSVILVVSKARVWVGNSAS